MWGKVWGRARKEFNIKYYIMDGVGEDGYCLYCIRAERPGRISLTWDIVGDSVGCQG